MKQKKIVWVLPGGGNQTAYSCGIILALKKLKIKFPDVIISSSGGAANAFYFISGQIDRANEIWANEISTKKILNGLRFWKMFNRDAMVDDVFMAGKNKLKLANLSLSKIKLFTAVTNKETGKIVFFSNKEKINLLHLLKATLTVPFFSGVFKDNSIKIKGKKYEDSRASARPELLIQEAIHQKATKILVLGGKKSWNYRYAGNFLHNIWLLTRSKEYQKEQKELEKIQKGFKPNRKIKIFFISQKNKLDMAPWENGKLQLRNAIRQGYKDTLRNKIRLIEFLKE